MPTDYSDSDDENTSLTGTSVAPSATLPRFLGGARSTSADDATKTLGHSSAGAHPLAGSPSAADGALARGAATSGATAPSTSMFDDGADAAATGTGARATAQQQPAAPTTSGIVAPAAQREDDAAIALGHNLAGNVRLEYYRTQLCRALLVLLVLGVLLSVPVPLLGLLLVPSSIMSLYWLRDSVRFQHGGDPSRCSNRDCSLSFLLCCTAVSGFISIVSFVFLISAVTHPDAAAAASTAHHRHLHNHRGLHVFALLLHPLLFIALPTVAYFTTRLRRVLLTHAEWFEPHDATV